MIKFNPRFDYTPIKRSSEEGKRIYLTPAGHKVPSVTTVLAATITKEKEQVLREWTQRVGEKKAKEIKTQAANRGTKMHTFLETYVKGAEFPERPSNPWQHASYVMADKVREEGLSKVDEIWGCEVNLYMPQLYAGTVDSAGVHLGEEAIIDYKQSNWFKKDEQLDDYKLQTVAYALAHNEIHGTKIRKGVIMIGIKPRTDKDGFLIMNEDGSLKSPPMYQEAIVEGEEFDKWTQVWWQRLEEYYMLRA